MDSIFCAVYYVDIKYIARLPFDLCEHELACKQEQFEIPINRLDNNQDRPRISKSCPAVVKNDLR